MNKHAAVIERTNRKPVIFRHNSIIILIIKRYPVLFIENFNEENQTQ